MRRRVQFLLVVGLILVLAPQVGFGQFPSPYNEGASSDAKPQGEGRFSPAPQNSGSRKATPMAPTSTAIQSTESYKIGALDVIDISVYGVPDLSVTAKVGDDGNLQLPLLGPTPATGKTAEELQRDITARLGADYLQNPQVSVLVKEFNSRTVIVTGAIKNGVYPLTGETTLLELVAGAGGFSEASDSTVLIIREQDGKRMAAKFDVSAIEKGKAPDVTLQAGDRILAGESMIKKAYGGAMKALGLAGRFAIF